MDLLTPKEIRPFLHGKVVEIDNMLKAQVSKVLNRDRPDIQEAKNELTFELGEVARQATNEEVAKAKRDMKRQLEEYICKDCCTPNFVHLVIPKKIWEEE